MSAPIIEYSKREFYNHELQPLRLPKASERLDPPLIDVLIEDGYRKGDVNLPEAQFIVNEIKAIVEDPTCRRGFPSASSPYLATSRLRSLGAPTASSGRKSCNVTRSHAATRGRSRARRGDIMFLSMVSAPNNVGAPLSRDTFEQRFNVAASRARDRMYLVRSVEPDRSEQRGSAAAESDRPFRPPFAKDEVRVEQMRRLCESPFEREMYDELTQRGYCVTPQVKVGQYRIDMVVEGPNDARMAVECDGDKYHGPDKWDDDMQRQRVLERAGWVFWRCFASVFIRRREEVIEELLRRLLSAASSLLGPKARRGASIQNSGS